MVSAGAEGWELTVDHTILSLWVLTAWEKRWLDRRHQKKDQDVAVI